MELLKRKELYYIIHHLSNSNSDKRELKGDTILRNKSNNILRNVNVSDSREINFSDWKKVYQVPPARHSSETIMYQGDKRCEEPREKWPIIYKETDGYISH